MMSQLHMGAPLYPCTVQVGPRFGNSGSLVEWKWCHSVMFEADITDIHLRLLHISTLDIYTVFEPLLCCLKDIWVHPYTISPAKLAPDWGILGSLVEYWCHYIMFEADFHLKVLHRSMLDKYKVFEPLLCCLKGIWVQPYTIKPTKLVPYLGIQVHLVTWKWSHYTMLEAETHLRPLHTFILDKKMV